MANLNLQFAVSSSSMKKSASATKVSSSSTKQTSSSSSSSVSLKSWSDLTLNQQISLFVQGINAKTTVSSDLTTDQFAMTGDIDNGEIFMDSSSNSIGKISYSGDNVTITENGSSSSDTLSNLIKTYFATTAEQNQTNAIAQNMVAPSNLTGKKATSSSSSTTATSGMDLNAIEAGNYASIVGTWKTEDGQTFVVTQNSITISGSGYSNTYTYGDPAGTGPWAIASWGTTGKIQDDVLNLTIPDAYLCMAPAGTNLENRISPANQTVSKDAIWTGQGIPTMSGLAFKVN